MRPILFGQAATRQILQSRRSAQCLFALKRLMASRGQLPAFGQRRLTLFNQEIWDAPGWLDCKGLCKQVCPVTGSQYETLPEVRCNLRHYAGDRDQIQPASWFRTDTGPRNKFELKIKLRDCRLRSVFEYPLAIGIERMKREREHQVVR